MTPKFLLLVFPILLACGQARSSDQLQSNEVRRTFLYFAYGSNMQTKRIHKNNPSAEPIAIAKLKQHRLDFIMYAPPWHGCVATIVPTENSEVWGVVWEIDEADMPYLDKQEGVHIGYYFAKNVTVRTPNGDELECRTYQQTRSPDAYVPPSELPPERQPSPAYLWDTIIDGAEEHNVPEYYLEFLRSFRHNSYEGPVIIT